MPDTLPTRPPDYFSAGPIDSADLAAVIGAWTSKKGVVAIWHPEPEPPKMRRGVVLGGLGQGLLDGHPFADPMRVATIFDAPAVAYDELDWPLPPLSTPESPVYIAYVSYEGNPGPEMPPGEYHVEIVNGKGCEVLMSDRGPLGPKPPGGDHSKPIPPSFLCTVQPGHYSGIQFLVRRVKADATPPRIYMERVGYGPLSDRFLDALRPASVVRLLGWQNLLDRAGKGPLTPAAFSQWDYRWSTFADGRCDPYWNVLAAQRVGATPWVCLPDGQSADYYRKAAKSIAEAATGPVIVEYSNEATFNSVFDQFHRINARRKPGENGPSRQYARESLAMLRIMREELGDKLHGVLCVHLVNPGIAAEVLDEASKATDFHTLVKAVAPSGYFYTNWAPPLRPTVEDIARDCAAHIDVPYRNLLTSHKTLADKYGLKLYCYEWGFHPPGGHAGHPMYSEYLNSPEIATNYAQAIAVCESVGVDLIMHMGLAGRPDTTWWLTNALGDKSAHRWRAFFGDTQ